MNKLKCSLIIAIMVLSFMCNAHATDYDYYIQSVVLLDEQDNQVNNLVEGGSVSTVVVTNNNATSGIVKLCLGLYDNGRLVDIQACDVTVGASASTTFTLSFSLENISENSEARLFVWDDLDGIMPLSSTFSTYSGYTIHTSVNDGEIYTVPVYCNSATTSFKIKFDPEYFAPDDLPSGSTVNNGIITYTSASTETISFEALQSGNTAISVFELN